MTSADSPSWQVNARTGIKVAMAAVAGAAFLPWAHATVGLFPGDSGVTLNFKGVDIQSDVGVNYGWIMIGTAVVAFIALERSSTRLLLGAGVAAVLVAGYSALTIASHTTSLSTDLLGLHAQVSTAYGSIVELLAALAPLGTAIRLNHRPEMTSPLAADVGSEVGEADPDG